MKPTNTKLTDWLVGLALFFMITTRGITQWFLSYASKISGQEIAAVSKAYEANPVIRLILDLQGFQFMLSLIVIPAAVFSFYYYLRWSYKNGRTDVLTVVHFSMLLFFVTLLNLINDAIILGTHLLK